MNELQLDVLGHRVRHFRKERGLTLSELGEIVDKPVPYLSQLENGKIEPKIGLLNSIATALETTVTELVDSEPPNRRAQLELDFNRMQDTPAYQTLGLAEPVSYTHLTLPTKA